MVRDIIREEFGEIIKTNKSERKTQIVAAENEVSMEDLIANESVVITISNDDYIKRMPLIPLESKEEVAKGSPACSLKRR